MSVYVCSVVNFFDSECGQRIFFTIRWGNCFFFFTENTFSASFKYSRQSFGTVLRDPGTFRLTVLRLKQIFKLPKIVIKNTKFTTNTSVLLLVDFWVGSVKKKKNHGQQYNLSSILRSPRNRFFFFQYFSFLSAQKLNNTPSYNFPSKTVAYPRCVFQCFFCFFFSRLQQHVAKIRGVGCDRYRFSIECIFYIIITVFHAFLCDLRVRICDESPADGNKSDRGKLLRYIENVFLKPVGFERCSFFAIDSDGTRGNPIYRESKNATVLRRSLRRIIISFLFVSFFSPPSRDRGSIKFSRRSRLRGCLRDSNPNRCMRQCTKDSYAYLF